MGLTTCGNAALNGYRRVAGTKSAGLIVGVPESPIENVTLENVTITAAQTGLEIRNARGVTLKNVTIKPREGAPLIVNDAEVAGLPAQGT